MSLIFRFLLLGNLPQVSQDEENRHICLFGCMEIMGRKHNTSY